MRKVVISIIIAISGLKGQPTYSVQWIDTLNLGVLDIGVGVSVGPNDKIYATGHFWNGSDLDILLLKMGENGEIIWCDTLSQGHLEYASDVYADSSGNLYLAGYTAHNFHYTYLIYKLDTSGNVVWMDTIQNGTMWARAHVTTDQAGGVLVTGNVISTHGLDIFLRKYTDNGNRIWSRTYDFGHDDDAMGITVSSDGFIYIGGKSNNGANDNFFVMKLDSSGNIVWTKRLDYGGMDQAWGITLGMDGFVYAAGQKGPSSTPDLLVVKLDPVTGDTVWTRVFSRGHKDFGRGITVDSDNHIFVTGSSSNASNNDFVLLGFSSDGSLFFVDTLDLDSTDVGEDISVDSRGNIFISGYSIISNRDFIVLKYEKQVGISEDLSVPNFRVSTPSLRTVKVDYEAEGNLSLIDASGRTIHREYITGKGSLSFKVSSPGIYFLLYRGSSGERYTSKVLVIR